MVKLQLQDDGWYLHMLKTNVGWVHPFQHTNMV